MYIYICIYILGSICEHSRKCDDIFKKTENLSTDYENENVRADHTNENVAMMNILEIKRYIYKYLYT
jgi:hypothetical protein